MWPPPANRALLSQARIAVALAFTVLLVLVLSTPLPSSTRLDAAKQWFHQEPAPALTPNPDQLRIAKVSMLYGDNELYERAIASHAEHNSRWGYPFHVLRRDIAGGYWNKPAYLLQLLIAELAKAPADRLEWLMWVDADLILLNPSVPLDVFLPPRDQFTTTHYIGNQDQNGLNTGTFFLRVHPWSVKMLTQTMAYPLIHPETDLHYSVDQEAMKLIFHAASPADPASPAVGSTNSEVLYQPRPWYNTYEFHHGYEGEPGNLLVHFPGLDDDRWPHMKAWLGRLDTEPDRWNRPLAETHYPEDIERYWASLREAQAALLASEHAPSAAAADLHDRLADHVRFYADKVQETCDMAAELTALLPTQELS